MNDTTLPKLPSSTGQDAPPTAASERVLSDNDVFPFLVHSQESVTNGGPPEVDNGRLARQKRRRTSPEDQATLEAEYKRNPKPDKTARLEIVKSVALGEKEVQIWFQNRRQNTRRKSRPLLPHEIAAFGLGGMAALSSDPILAATFGGSFGSSQSSDQVPDSPEAEQNAFPPTLVKGPEQPFPGTPSPSANSDNNLHGKGPTMEASQPTITPLKANTSFQSSESFDNSFSASQGLPQSVPSTLGYLSNRWNAGSSFGTPPTSQTPAFMTPLSFDPQLPSSCPERLNASTISTPSSNVRLSLSLDGKAELVSTEHSSSPPRPQQSRPSSALSSARRRSGGLQRSQSALPFASISPRDAPSTPFVPRLPTGRSRDARTWEFCADAEARDELTTQAENESSGSAVAAISLIRSTSSTALKSNANKRNAPSGNSEKQRNGSGKKPMLVKAASTLAIMQTAGGKPRKNSTKPKEKDDLVLVQSPGGESDKENWIPGEGTEGSQTRRPLPSHRPKLGRAKALGNAKSFTAGTGSNLGRNRTKITKSVGAEIFEDPEDEVVDGEVEKFMRGEVSPSKKGDLDCIQGLLSLSQGNWR
ncbi:hypothetical protein V493_01443 [Pseudogymnoascus sp. VKM F-4281 (FW-2241)]|nr:hypothetical protein V493_01443 [Pseudogymnoascus sp. VKM F-4281 (FW-2241)]